MASPSYAVITPVRDEEQYIPAAIASMAAQTVTPCKWVLVNDGSRDRTGEMIDQAAATYPWISAVHRRNRGSRQAGSGVIAAFYDGYALITGVSWDYVVKCDGDISFPPDFFEKCLREFETDPRLGIGGGTCCKPSRETMEPEFEGEPSFHVRGPMKIYRRQCFEDIGGLIQAPGWDTVDQVTANMIGWKTRTFPHIALVHHRPTGGAYGDWRDSVKNGLANYITGYQPLFMACKCLRRTFRRPHSAGLAMWIGFMKGYFLRIPQAPNRDMIRYLRGQQWRALTLQESLWRLRPRTPSPMHQRSSPDAAPLSKNARGIADSFEVPEWYLNRFAANIRIRAETVSTLTEGIVFDRVLDIGCGDGSLSIPLMSRARRIMFLDPSSAMLARVAERIGHRESPVVDYANVDFMKAKLPTDSFDLVLCVGVLAYVRNLAPFIAKVRSLLQPGGRLLLECTEGAHGLTWLERGYQSVTALIKPRPFTTYLHRKRDIISITESQGLRMERTFQYAYGAPLVSKLLSPPKTYKLIRQLYGTVEDNRRSWLGNQCIFSLQRL